MHRRTFLAHAGGCAAHLALAAAALPAPLRAAWARRPLGTVVAREPFATLERVADGVWAVVSTPLGGDRRTLCNGGLVAGRHGVLAVEAFLEPGGAGWLAQQAKRLTGRWPTHVVLTHYHADHTGGIEGYRDRARAPYPSIRATPQTRDRAVDQVVMATRGIPPQPAWSEAMDSITLLDTNAPSTLDLGGRVVRLVPRAGHTASDLTVELDDPSVVFAGDLVWSAMFPNYVDATPSRLAASARALPRSRKTVYVPGHGPLGHAADVDRYLDVLGVVEQAARAAHAAGKTAAEGAAGFVLPASFGEWAVLNPAFRERAFTAWYKEL